MAKGLNIAFAGTPDLAAHLLEALVGTGRHSVSCVFTQPDRPSGRGKKLHRSPVREIAEKHDLPVFQPHNKYELEKESVLESIDVLVVAAYGLILTEKVLGQPRLGCINVHMSLLPKWRGAAPIQHAILAGDDETGITIMQMDEGLDTGDILLQQSCSISPDETTRTLTDKLYHIGCQCITRVLEDIENDCLQRTPQDHNKATYAPKISKQDAVIDWSKPADEIHRLIRAMNPAPVAVAEAGKQTIKVWESEIIKADNQDLEPGTIVSYSSQGLEIAAGRHHLNITKLQLPGKKPLTSSDFFNGKPSMWSGHDQAFR